MATVRQIAQLAKVSPATVSRALADHPHVRPETRRRIQEIARLYHYSPTRTLPDSALTKTIKIACLVPSVSADYYDLVLEGILEATTDEQYHVMIVQTHHVFAHTCAAIVRMIEQQVDGVIILSGHAEVLPKSALMALWSHNIVPISIDDTRLPIDSVLTDEQVLGEEIIRYLKNLGHRQIGCVANTYDLAKPSIRIQQLAEVVKRLGLGQLARLYCENDDVLSLLIADQEPPTALITSDGFAAEFIQRAGPRGVRIPHDISLVGYGNLPFAAKLSPPLTTVEQHPVEVGRRAVALLLQRIAEGHSGCDFTPEIIRVPAELVMRHTCDKPRTARKIVPERPRA